MTPYEIRRLVASFLCDELVPSDCEQSSLGEARLISEGIIDSMASLRLVAFLEEQFDVVIRIDQVNAHHLDTLDRIVETVMNNKLQERG